MSADVLMLVMAVVGAVALKMSELFLVVEV